MPSLVIFFLPGSTADTADGLLSDSSIPSCQFSHDYDPRVADKAAAYGFAVLRGL